MQTSCDIDSADSITNEVEMKKFVKCSRVQCFMQLQSNCWMNHINVNSNWSVTYFYSCRWLFPMLLLFSGIESSNNLNSIHYSFNLCECLNVAALESSSWINSMVIFFLLLCFSFSLSLNCSDLIPNTDRYSKRPGDRASEWACKHKQRCNIHFCFQWNRGHKAHWGKKRGRI